MEPAEIIRTIYRHNRLWKIRTDYETFCKALGVNFEQKKTYKITRFMKGGTYEELEKALADPEKQRKVEELLQLPGLFSATTLDEIHAIVRGGSDVRLAEISVGTPIENDRPATCEIAAAEHLLQRITADRKRPVAWWPTNFQSGGTFIAQLMASLPVAIRRYSRAFVARPSSRLAPFDEELRALAKTLGVAATGAALAGALIEHRVLLVLVQHQPASTRAAESSSRKTLLWELFYELKAVKVGDTSGAILALGETEWSDQLRTTGLTLKQEMESLLKVAPGDRWEFFKQQWRRFRSLRKIDRTDEAGSTLKRARWHYEGVRERPIPPIHIRLRAIIGSNSNNLSTFDPTAGLIRMVGPVDQIPADIRSFIEDIEGFLEATEGMPYADSATRVLRLIATSRYWLTHRALEDFYGVLEPKKKFDIDWVDARLADVSPAISKDDTPKGIRYVAGVGLKAIVQDHWRARNPADRAFIHHLVAQRLHDGEKDDATFQSLEFPYEAHWGDSQLFVGGEIIRHLMRSVESWPVKLPARPNPIHPPQTQLDFPDAPEQNAADRYASEVLEYCYVEIFGNRLNRRIHDPDARALSDRHGLYMLAAELMQLMSDGNIIGTPHPALPLHLRRSFIRECGFVLLNIGELKKAQSCFEQLLQEGSPANPLDQLTDRLDLALVMTVRGLKVEAAGELAAAEMLVGRISGPAPLNGAAAERLKRLKGRLHGRRAYIAYFNEDYSRCRDLLRELGAPDAMNDPDLLHVYIVSLIRLHGDADPRAAPSATDGNDVGDIKVAAAKGVPSLKDEALIVCYQALFRLSSAGLLHEAIGFRIALARYTRSIDMRMAVSEAILDQVHLDILKHGCSERTFLAFMLEAGRLLKDDERELRAYASYLRPCLERSVARGYVRDASRAAELALGALDEIENRRKAGSKAWQDFVELQLAEEMRYQEKDEPRSSDGYPLDPLYGYSFADSRDLISRFASEETFEETVAGERRLVASMQAKAIEFA